MRQSAFFNTAENDSDGRFSGWICKISDLKSLQSSGFARITVLKLQNEAFKLQNRVQLKAVTSAAFRCLKL